MVIRVGITKAKAILYELVARAEAGDKVILTRWGKDVATLKPHQVQASSEAAG